jgi:hypothetical protein
MFAGHGRGRAGTGRSRADAWGVEARHVERADGAGGAARGGVSGRLGLGARTRTRFHPTTHTTTSGLGDAHGPTGVDWRARNRDASPARTADTPTGYATDRHGTQRHECGTRTPSRTSPSADP